jgi:uncharacterized protein (DUF433 family)
MNLKLFRIVFENNEAEYWAETEQDAIEEAKGDYPELEIKQVINVLEKVAKILAEELKIQMVDS